MRLPPLPPWALWGGVGVGIAAVLLYALKSSDNEGGGTWGGDGSGGGGGGGPLPDIPFVQAKHIGTGRNGTKIDQIIIHTAETPETGSAAKNVANYFATTDTVASAHYIVDSDSIYQSVKEDDQAWHAAGDNARSIGIEHAGYAKQTADDWSNEYNQKMLALSARLAADIASRYGIPVVRLSVADLIAGKPGFASHKDVSAAFKKSDHADPGPDFPWTQYLQMVQSHMGVA